MSQLLDQMRDAVRVRHYSLRTEQTYAHWVVRFVRFHGMRHPRDMGAPEINAFLTHLAVNDNVTASTQNQALSALVFLYRRVLNRDPGDFGDIIRARRPRELPVILSPGEVQRIMELVRLRIKDVDFDYHRLCVRDGKGGKDRYAILPECLEDGLRRQIARVLELHKADLAAAYARSTCPMPSASFRSPETESMLFGTVKGKLEVVD